MEPPAPKDLAHDLRNMLGLVRVVAADLLASCGEWRTEMHEVSRDLDGLTRFALDALRVVEKWDDAAPIDVHLGAWAWALRLRKRELRVGELHSVGRATLVVPEALDAGVALVEAMSGGRTVDLIARDALVVFEAMGRAANVEALAGASDRLRALGLVVEVLEELPCRVAVRGQ